MVDTLLALESGGADADAIDSLFRDAHTIKGGAGMVGLDDVRDLAHAMEDVLAQARTAGEFPPQLADPLLRAADALRRHVAGDGEATPGLLDELAASLGARRRRSSPTTRPPSPTPATTAQPLPSGARSACRRRRSTAARPRRRDRPPRRRLEHVLGDERAGGDQPVSDELDLGGGCSAS